MGAGILCRRVLKSYVSRGGHIKAAARPGKFTPGEAAGVRAWRVRINGIL